MALTKEEIKTIASRIRKSYDPKNKIASGHAKFGRSTVSELGNIGVSWKEGKNLHVELVKFVKLDMGKITKEDLQLMLDHFDELVLISEELNKKTED